MSNVRQRDSNMLFQRQNENKNKFVRGYNIWW